MIPFRVIRSGVLLTGLLAALGTLLSAASGGFTAALSPEQKAVAGLNTLSNSQLAALDRLVALDVVRVRHASLPGLTDPYSQRYTEIETKEAGLDRLTPEQLAKLDGLITTAIAAAPPPPSLQPRERPRVRDGEILSEKGRMQVHGGMSLTMGWASGGRNYREVGAWVSYFDPVTGLGLSIGFSRYSGDILGSSYGRDYYSNSPYVYSSPRNSFSGFDLGSLDRNEFSGDGASLPYPTLVRPIDRGFRR
jgi:hypothetical protein